MVILWIFSPKINIPLGLALPIGLLFILLTLTFFSAAYESFKMSKRVLPRVVATRKIDKQGNELKVLCILEPSELFSYDSLVSFYYIEEGFEQLIGIGHVFNIQEDGKIQVMITKLVEEHIEIIKKLAQNDAIALRKIVVKPNVPRRYIDMMYPGG